MVSNTTSTILRPDRHAELIHRLRCKPENFVKLQCGQGVAPRRVLLDEGLKLIADGPVLQAGGDQAPEGLAQVDLVRASAPREIPPAQPPLPPAPSPGAGRWRLEIMSSRSPGRRPA